MDVTVSDLSFDLVWRWIFDPELRFVRTDTVIKCNDREYVWGESMKTALLVSSILLIFSGVVFAQTAPNADDQSTLSVRPLNPDDDSSSLSKRQSAPRDETPRTGNSSSSSSASRFGYTTHRIEMGSSSAGANSNYRTPAQPAKAPTPRRTSSWGRRW